jgi:hypothetical protein
MFSSCKNTVVYDVFRILIGDLLNAVFAVAYIQGAPFND